MYSDNACTVQLGDVSAFQANACGSGRTEGNPNLVGIFFSCATLDEPPSLSNQNNDVFNDLTYINNGCGASDIYQSLSYIGNDVCVFTEARSCICNGTTCNGYTIKTPCTGSAGQVTPTGVCDDQPIGGAPFSRQSECKAAEMPTVPPTNPENPPGTDLSTIAACSAATSSAQCIGQGILFSLLGHGVVF